MKAFLATFLLYFGDLFCFHFSNQSFRRGEFFLVTKPFYPGIGGHSLPRKQKTAVNGQMYAFQTTFVFCSDLDKGFSEVMNDVVRSLLIPSIVCLQIM